MTARSALLIAFILLHTGPLAADERTELVAAVRAKVVAQRKDPAVQQRLAELEALLARAEVGRVNKLQRQAVFVPPPPQTGPVIYGSDKAKADFLDQIKTEIRRVGMNPGDGDPAEVFGELQVPIEVGSVGRIPGGKGRVKEVKDGVVLVRVSMPMILYRERVVRGQRIREPYQSFRSEEVAVSGIPTDKLVEEKEVDLIGLFSAAGPATFDRSVVELHPVKLTPAEWASVFADSK